MKHQLNSLVQQHGTPLNVFSKHNFRTAYQNMQNYLPNVKHHFAIKSLPISNCIIEIENCNGYLDVASVGEINIVNRYATSMLKKCIYTHPIKKIEDVEFALSFGITTMVAENTSELRKLLPYASQIKLLIRIAFPNKEAICNLSEKFGIIASEADQFICEALEMGFNVIGCSFHVGSGMLLPTYHVQAIIACKKIYNAIQIKMGYTFSVLNIGGGFPGQFQISNTLFYNFCNAIQQALVKFFPDTEIWSEPGRCIAAGSMLTLAKVVGKKTKDEKQYYYLDDGVYGTFSGIIYDHASYKILPLHTNESTKYPCTFAGPTCDSIDVIDCNAFCQNLEIGEIVYAKNIGAYGRATMSNFNSLPMPMLAVIETIFEEEIIEDLEIA